MSTDRTTQILEHQLNTGWSVRTITSTTLTGITCDVVAATKTVTRAAGSWITDLIEVGDILTFSGFADAKNNVAYTVSTVSALTLTGTTAAAMANATADEGVQAIPATKCVHVGKGKFDILTVVTGAVNVTPYDGTTALWGTVASTADLNLYCAPIQYDTALKLLFSADAVARILYKAEI
jgi:hypothetical protein